MKKKRPEEALAPWVERELVADAIAGRLGFVHDRGSVRSTAELLRAGRSVVVCGERGVGKTSLVHGVLQDLLDGEDAREWRRRRVVQISLQQGASTVTRNGPSLSQLFLEMIDAVVDAGESTLVYVRDVELAWGLDLESEMPKLAMRAALPVLCEGQVWGVRALLAETAEVEQRYSLVWVPEPGLQEVRGIVEGWASAATERGQPVVEPGAIDAAVELSNRFLVRGRMPQKALQPLQQLVATRSRLGRFAESIDRRSVIDYLCHQHELPRRLVDPEERLDLDLLEARLDSRVVGQPHAVRALVDTVARIKSGLVADDRPCGVYLFTGPTGVGKTYLVQSLARELFGGANRTVRINMADYRDPESVDKLFGCPTAYSRLARNGLLVAALRARQFGVLLLDEFDKADPVIHDRFLQLFDEGVLTTQAGERVTCRSFLIIATSNAGVDVWKQNAAGFEAENGRDEKLRQRFRFELLNRFDDVVHFDPLSRADFRLLAATELAKVEGRSGLARAAIRLTWDEHVLDWLVDRGVDDKHGARLLRRTVEREVTAPVARLILDGRPEPGGRVCIACLDGGLAFAIEPVAPSAPGPVASAGF